MRDLHVNIKNCHKHPCGCVEINEEMAFVYEGCETHDVGPGPRVVWPRPISNESTQSTSEEP